MSSLEEGFNKNKVYVDDNDFNNNNNNSDDDDFYDENEMNDFNEKEVYYSILKNTHQTLIKYIEDKSLIIGEFITISKLENFINKISKF